MTRFMPEDWPLPQIDDLNRNFYTSGRLLLQQCNGCGIVQHPPEEVCHECVGMDFTIAESEGEGSIYSYIVPHHAPNDLLKSLVPFGIVLVQLSDIPHVRIIGNVVNMAPGKLAIGLPVRVVWEEAVNERGEVIKLPKWEVYEQKT